MRLYVKSYLVVATAFCVAGCERPEARRQHKLAPQVRVSIARRGELPTLLELSGEIEATRKSVVSAQQSGLVRSVECRVGDQVRQGQVLLRLEPGRTEAEVRQQEALLASALARVEKARINVQLAQHQNQVDIAQATQNLRQARFAVDQAQTQLQANIADRDRNKDLLAQKAVASFDYQQSVLKVRMSEDSLKTSQSKAESARVALVAARQGSAQVQLQQSEVNDALASVQQAQASLDAARVGLAGYTIYAPGTGIVVDRQVEPGQSVGPGGNPLITIAENSRVQITAQADSRYLPQLRPGIVARVRADQYPQRQFQARLHDTLPNADAETNTIKVHFKPDSLPPEILNGTTVRLSLNLGSHQGILFPVAALRVDSEDRESIWVVRDSKARKLSLEVLFRNESTGLAKPGSLQDGEAVVISGQEGLEDGGPVRIVKQNEPYANR